VLRRLKVWVLTSSDEQRDRTSASVLGIEGYLVKPPRAAMLASIVASLTPAASATPAEPT
jgi:CheY-like chemotaxis protein